MIITHGYLIKREDYDIFDEIITFINEHGLKFTCFCHGTRKITSKNARALNYGDYLEFHFFHSTTHLSKLKKVACLSHIEEKYKTGWSLTLINDYLSQIEIEHKKYFQFYQKLITKIIDGSNDYHLMLWILINTLKWLNMIASCENKHYDQKEQEKCLWCNLKNDDEKIKIFKAVYDTDTIEWLVENKIDIKVIAKLDSLIMEHIYHFKKIFTSCLRFIK